MLEHLSIHLTEKCRTRCEYCYLLHDGITHNDLTFEDIATVVDHLNPNNLWFYGGEPFKKKELLLSLLDHYSHKICRTFTAGIGVSHEDMEEVIGKVKEIHFTLDDYRYELNSSTKILSEKQHNHLLDLVQSFPQLTVQVNYHPDSDKILDHLDWLAERNMYIETDFVFTKEQRPFQTWPLYKYFRDNPEAIKRIVKLKPPCQRANKLRLHSDRTLSKCFTREMNTLATVDNITQFQPWQFHHMGRIPTDRTCQNCTGYMVCKLNGGFAQMKKTVGYGNTPWCQFYRWLSEQIYG